MPIAALALAMAQVDAQQPNLDAHCVAVKRAADDERDYRRSQKDWRDATWRLQGYETGIVAEPDPSLLPAGLPDDFRAAVTGVEFTVDASGHAADCGVGLSSGNAALDYASCKLILERTVALPKMRDGQPVSSRLRIGIYWSRKTNEQRRCNDDGGAITLASLHALSGYYFGDIRADIGKAVQIQLAIDAGGTPVSCRVLQATMSVATQDQICQTAPVVMHFLPAIDAQGVRHATLVTKTVRFRASL